MSTIPTTTVHLNLTLPHVKKRTEGRGEEVFDTNKIESALTRAWISVEKEANKKTIQKIVLDAVEYFSKLEKPFVSVEEIQDFLEIAILRSKNLAVARAYITYRQSRAIKRASRTTKNPDPYAISSYVFAAKYARYLPELKRREVYSEMVSRVENMHLKRYPSLKEEITYAFDAVRRQEVLPSMRAAQFGGEAVEKVHARQYNCSFTHIDRWEAFSEAFYLLLAGCGVGYSIQFDHIEKLSEVGYINPKKIAHHVVEDTIEGWAESLRYLLLSYQMGHTVEFSYYKIRNEGAPLVTSGGKAPGHLPLKKALESIREILNGAVGRKLRPVECHRIMCLAADAVLSGGIRRSAMIALFSLEDNEMMQVKTGQWWVSEPYLANANNSVVLKRDTVKKKNFKRIFSMTKQWGEPGFNFTWDTDYGVNPCFHPDTRIWTSEGYEKIGDLFKKGTKNRVVADLRIGKGDTTHESRRGVVLQDATNVFLTKKQARVFKLTTEHGYSVVTTAQHEFPTPSGRKKLEELQIGDTLLIPSGEGSFGNFGGTREEGILVGSYTGDGTSATDVAFIDIWKEDFDQKDALLQYVNNVSSTIPSLNGRDYGEVSWYDRKNKDGEVFAVRTGGVRFRRWLETIADNEDISTLKMRVPEKMWRGSRDFVAGYLQGLFATDGTVLLGGKGKKATLSLRLGQTNKRLLEDVQVLLSMFGIVSRIYSRRPAGYRPLPDNKGKGEYKDFFCKEFYELIINRPNVLTFLEKIGLFGRKSEILSHFVKERGEECRKPEKFITKIISIEDAGVSDVFCLTQPETNTVIANGIVTAQCSEINLYPVLKIDSQEMVDYIREKKGISVSIGETFTGFAFCVSGDTNLLTRTGRVKIGEVVGQPIEIWNGSEWCNVTPFKTGSNRKLFRVTLGDGSYLDCTENHKWLVKDRFMKDFIEVETKDLLNVSKYRIHTPRANVIGCDGTFEPYAYEYGFFTGDGNISTHRRDNRTYTYPCAYLYGVKNNLPLRGKKGPLGTNPNGVSQSRIHFDSLSITLCQELKQLDSIPNEVFSWDQDSILSFVGGWADSDGSNTGRGIRIYGTEGRMRDLQILLTKVGINSSVGLMSEAGKTTNMGRRTVAMWYVGIPNPSGIKTYRVQTDRGQNPRHKGKDQVIRSVVEIPGVHDTFCLEEPKKHLCLFNNVITKQCNLTEINASKFKSLEEFKAAAEAAAIIGTLQAGYTDFPYLGWVTEVLAEREALLGVSMTGIMDAPGIALNPEYQETCAAIVLETNRRIAEKMGINPTARGTTVKPAGTSSLLLGCVGSGIHPHHAKRYIRRITANENESVFQFFKKSNPHMCVRKPNGDWVIEFVVEAPPGSILKKDIGAIDFLEKVRLTQIHWVNPGTGHEKYAPGARHNVSNTVIVKPDEWDKVAEYLWEHKNDFTGVSFLPATGDKDYAFAPNEEISTDIDELRWNAILESYVPVDYSTMVEETDNTDLKGEAACAGGACEVK